MNERTASAALCVAALVAWCAGIAAAAYREEHQVAPLCACDQQPQGWSDWDVELRWGLP